MIKCIDCEAGITFPYETDTAVITLTYKEGKDRREITIEILLEKDLCTITRGNLAIPLRYDKYYTEEPSTQTGDISE